LNHISFGNISTVEVIFVHRWPASLGKVFSSALGAIPLGASSLAHGGIVRRPSPQQLYESPHGDLPGALSLRATIALRTSFFFEVSEAQLRQ
jgi:hypothetical protein